MTSQEPNTLSNSSPPSLPYIPKAIIFDLLTGLLDSWTLWDASVPPNPSSSDGRTWRERYLKLTFQQGNYIPYESLVRKSAEDVGLSSYASDNLLQNWQRLKSWPEVPRVLGRLREAIPDVKLAVVTNCSTELGKQAVASLCHAVQEEIELPFHFDVVVTAEESGWYKPKKQAYEAGLIELGLGPEDVLFVAGSAGDVAGAANVGMRVVWNNHVGLEREGGVEPWKEGRSLDEALQGLL